MGVDPGRPLVVVVRLVGADGACDRAVALRWRTSPRAAELLDELCVRALEARRDGCELVVVEPAEVVALLAALGLGSPAGHVVVV